MDQIIVTIIVAAAVAFLVKRVVDIWKGKKTCECGKGCSCNSNGTCTEDQFIKK